MIEKEVTLPLILEARDRRELFRRKLLRPRDSILIQLGLNTPGSIKNSVMIKEIFQEGVKEISQLFGNFIIKKYISPNLPTGPEGFFLLQMSPESAKERCITIEKSHTLGRLWDMDIYRTSGIPVSRSEMNLSPRKCFICEDKAHNCARSSKHDKKELEGHILNLYNSFKSGKSDSELK